MAILATARRCHVTVLCDSGKATEPSLKSSPGACTISQLGPKHHSPPPSSLPMRCDTAAPFSTAARRADDF